MSAQTKIKTRCPACNAAYQVPDSTVGHRARCPKCDSVFRVVVPGVSAPPEGQPRSSAAASDRPAEAVALHPSGNTPTRPVGPPPHLRRERGPGHPTEDDIVDWLMEGTDQDELPPGPRRWESPPAPPAETAPPARKASA